MSHDPGASPKVGPAARDIIVIGASAGGVEPLLRLAEGLPADLPAAVFVVLHMPPHHRSLLPQLLSRGPLAVSQALDGEAIRQGHIYVAPPDRHLLIEQDHVRLSAGPRENFARPAVDVLFRSAALAYGPRVVGVVLSGTMSDGTAGLWEIKVRGGTAIVQTVGDAQYPDMPFSAMNRVRVDYVLPVAEMPRLLARLADDPEDRLPGREGNAMAGIATAREGASYMAEKQRGLEGMQGEKPGDDPGEKPGEAAVERDMAEQVAGERDGALTVYTCPECGGALWQANAGQMIRFRCHVGHVYAADNLLEGYTDNLERSLWYAIRTLRDKANLARQLANDARHIGDTELAARQEEKARTDEEHSARIEQMLAATTSVNRAG